MASPEVRTPKETGEVTGKVPGISTPASASSQTWLLVLRRSYVPVLAVLLTVLVGNWLAAVTERNVEEKTEQLNEREAIASIPGLSPADVAETQAVLHPAAAPVKRTQLLYLGDSQVFSRPDAPPGALNTAQWLQVLLSRQDDQAVRVRIGASPGTDIPEMLLKTVAATEQQPRQADIIVADIALAELRDLGVRSEIASLAGAPEVNSALRSLIAANPDLADADKTLGPVVDPQEPDSGEQKTDQSSSGKTSGKVEERLADRMEDALQRKAEGWSLFAQRENLVALGLLRYAQWEHRLLHITSDTRIPTPTAPYRTNLQVLDLLIRYAQSHNIHVILFFGPVRDRQPNPDAPSDLARMHRDVTALCERHSVTCLDYSHAVPEALWADYSANQRGAFAMMAGQHDFYHYTEEAHKTLAEKIVGDAGAEILLWSGPAKSNPAGSNRARSTQAPPAQRRPPQTRSNQLPVNQAGGQQ
jgi:hypothetical protein